MIFTEVFQHLDKFCKNETTKSALFNFEYNNGLFTGIYLPIPKSILITCKNANASWVLESNNNENVNVYIPNDIFQQVSDYVCTSDEKGDRKTSPFFEELQKHLLSLPLNTFKEAPTDLLIKNARTAKTNDTKYDEKGKGDKVYFDHWRRNKVHNVSTLNLQKTRRWFGEEIYEYCKKYNISSRWLPEPSKNIKQHLLFFDTTEAKAQLREKRMTCPKCSKPLIEKINSQSKESFLGCKGFPLCRHTENVD
ncbi:TPA: topoisomerase DNA-binding C4 zinc finger domain-containing protein [Bacillus pseudomycoides]|nr:topoisomerase DNA-binding C4 zinc finger domain-containing protein [Bacillus pseudomycoides]